MSAITLTNANTNNNNNSGNIDIIRLLDTIDRSKKVFVSEKLNLETFNNKYKSNRLDLDPPHQRNVVHNNIWQSGIIESLILGTPIGTPEFDTFRYNGRNILRSLDGKQRAMAALRYINNKYKFKTTNTLLEQMNNKLFNELPTQLQDYIMDIPFEIKITKGTLTDNEINSHFQKKQETKQTSAGEKFHSLPPCIRSRKVVFKILEDNSDILNILITNDNRMKKEELIHRMVYGVDAYLKKKIMDPKISQILNSYNNDTIDITLINSGVAQRIIHRLLILLNHIDVKNKSSKTFVLPLLALYLNVNQRDDANSAILEKFVKERVDDDFYENVGGEHNATKSRRIKLLKDFNEYNNTLTY